MICVRCAPSYAPERKYILDTIFGEFLGLSYRVEAEDRPDWRLTLDGAPESGAIFLPDVLFATPERDWLTPAALPKEQLASCTLPDDMPLALSGTTVPVIYGLPSNIAVRADGNEIRLALDIFGSAFFMLTRLEECVYAAEYPNGRLPAATSIAYQHGFLDQPVVNEFTDLLWYALNRLWPELERKPRQFRVMPSHDIDLPFASSGRPLGSVLRSAVGDAFNRRDMKLALRRLQTRLGAPATAGQTDPYWTFDKIMACSEAHHQTSTFYFLVDDTAFSLQHPRIINLMRQIHERGHEIGVHPTLDTHTKPEGIVQAKATLMQALELAGVSQPTIGGRQHFLQWTCPDTWDAYAAAGLAHDSSLSYFDHAGFRCGTCYDYPVFNLQTRQRLPLFERPLIVMELSLLKYEKLNAEAALHRIDLLKAHCRKHDGNFTILWHNSELYDPAQFVMYEQAVW